MDHAVPVRHRERVGHLSGDRHRGRHADPAARGDQLLDRDAGDEFHREVMHALGVAEIVRARDVRMADPPREPHFRLEPLDVRRVPNEIGPERLQRDLVVQLAVARAIHGTHRARADDFEDLVAPGEHAADRQRARIRHGRQTGAASREAARVLDVASQLHDLRAQPVLPRPDLRRHAVEHAGQPTERVGAGP